MFHSVTDLKLILVYSNNLNFINFKTHFLKYVCRLLIKHLKREENYEIINIYSRSLLETN